jgi:hypothetical protein
LINQVLLGLVWYVIALWRGDDKQLCELENKMCAYLWEGQKDSTHHRVNYVQLIQPRKEGGLGLLAVESQSCSIVGKFFLWSLSEGDHPLQRLFRVRILRLSEAKWGVTDFTWVFHPSKVDCIDSSPVWKGLQKSWAKAKAHVTFKVPCTEVAQRVLSLWTPAPFHVNKSSLDVRPMLPGVFGTWVFIGMKM